MFFQNATGLAFWVFLVFFSFIFLLWTLLRWNQKLFFFFFLLLLLLCFWSKVQWWCNIAFFLVICIPFRKIHARRLLHGISAETVITALVCLLSLFFSFLSPFVAQCRRSSSSSSSSVHHQMDFWSLLYATECVRRFIVIVKLWILGNIFDCGRGHWTETDVCITT